MDYEYKASFPHCDQEILHFPKTCEFCDMFPELQEERIKNNINFTGENNPNKTQCPAEARRNLRVINRWHGNTPKPKEENFDFDKYNGIKK